MKRLIAAMALATVGFAVPASAYQLVVEPEDITYFEIDDTYTLLRVVNTNAKPEESAGCQNNDIHLIIIDSPSPLHDRAFTFMTTASVTGKDLLFALDCSGPHSRPAWIHLLK